MGRKKGKKDEGICGGIVDHENYEWKMYIKEQEAGEFESATRQVVSVVIKLN
jgi:hypothetical protein